MPSSRGRGPLGAGCDPCTARAYARALTGAAGRVGARWRSRCPWCGPIGTGCTTRAPRSSSACARPATEVPARAEAIRAALDGAATVVARAQPDAGVARRPRPRAGRVPRGRVGAVGGRRPTQRSRPGPRRPLRVRPPGPAVRPGAGAARRGVGAAGPVRLRHDDADRPGHLGGGARGRRRGADRGRPRARRRAASPTPAAARPATTSRAAATAARATSTTPRSRRQRLRARASGRGRRARRRRPPRQRHPGDLLRRAPTCSSAPSTSIPAPGWFPHFLGFADETGAGAGAAPTSTSRWRRAAATTRGWRPSPSSRLGRATTAPRRSSSRSASTPPRAIPESPLRVTAAGFRAAGRALGALGLPTVVVQEGGYDLAAIGALVSRGARRASRRATRCLSRGDWVGATSTRACRRRPRRDLEPPPHWRLEAIAATERPRSLTVGADGRRAVFIQDRDTSDVWLLDLDAAPAAADDHRPRPGAVLGGHEPRLSPDGATVAYADQGHVWLVPAAGGPPRRLLEGDGPVWIDDRRLVVAVERDERDAPRGGRRRRPVAAAPGGRRGGPGRATATRRRPPSRPTAARSPTRSRPAPTSTAPRSASPTSRAARSARSPGRRGMHDTAPAWSPDGARLAYASERAGFYELHVVDADGGERAPAHARGRRPLRARVAPRRRPHRRRARRAQPLRPRRRRRGHRRGRRRRARRRCGARRTGPPTARSPPPTRTTRRRPSCASCRRASRGRVLAPAPLLGPRARRTCAARSVTLRSFDGLEIPGLPVPPARRGGRRPCPRSSIRTAARPSATPTSGTATRSTSSTRATPGSRSTSAARPATGATSSARNHGVWGVDDTKDCLAAADFLRTLDWVDGDRLGDLRRELRLVHGAAARSPTTPSTASAARSAKYGDCDIVTSWAQGDRGGVQDLERMMGTPSGTREAYRAGSPVHRLENVARAAADRPRRARRARAARSSPRSSSPSCAASARPSST